MKPDMGSLSQLPKHGRGIKPPSFSMHGFLGEKDLGQGKRDYEKGDNEEDKIIEEIA